MTVKIKKIWQQLLDLIVGMYKFLIKLPKKETPEDAIADSPTNPTHTDPTEGTSVASADVPAAESVSTKSVSLRRFVPGWTTNSANNVVLCSTCREIFRFLPSRK